MALLDDAKQRLRITNTVYDGEIADLIEEAKSKLEIVGILEEKIVDTDPLIKCAIVTYCKANFGFDNPDADKLNVAFESMRDHLSLSEEYTESDSV